MLNNGISLANKYIVRIDIDNHKILKLDTKCKLFVLQLFLNRVNLNNQLILCMLIV